MTRRMRDLRPGILQRCADSGLGTGCAEAQADGVPCAAPDGDCGSCERAVAAVASQAATRLTQPPESAPAAFPSP